MTPRPLRTWILLAAIGMAAYVLVANMLGALFAPYADSTSAPVLLERAPDAADWDALVDLAGVWAMRVGDDPAWAADGLGLAGWSTVPVPGAWENAGFHGLDGTAWLRTTFDLSKPAVARAAGPAFLLLGRIDDADEVWLNGVFVGSTGRMPPHYETASFLFRRYRVPPGVLRAGPNTLAVRVHDAGLEGGILEGPVTLSLPTAANPESVPMVADLSGDWALRLGDGPGLAAPDLDDAGWDRVRVPARWEPQGIDYDGVAWARRAVELSAEDAKRDLVLVLGAVDDLDETFVNGVRVGVTGDMEARQIRGDEWQRERAYRVPPAVLRAGRNVVAVRIYDEFLDGGITRGPVGLMTPEAYARRQALSGGAEPGAGDIR